MKITEVETLQLPEHAEYIWVLVHTDSDLVGLGETMPRVGGVRRIVHEVLAPVVIGQNPLEIERLWLSMFQAIHYHGYAGSEMRALSAIDIALWDLLGKVTDQPVYQLLGGACREELPIYNTCVSRGPFRDHERFLDDPGGLARELLDEGITAMKIWPFDEESTSTLGQSIGRDSLERGTRAFGEIREAVGDSIDVALEGHACWNLPSAIRIARALEPYQPMWLEDLIPADDVGALKALKTETSIPICGSERLFSRFQFAPLIEQHAVDIVMADLAWAGGITEFRKIASHASTHLLPVAPHNCHGPIAAAATLHAAASTPNLFVVETVRAFYRTFYEELATGFPQVIRGTVRPPEAPGLGVELRPEVLSSSDAVRELSEGPGPSYFASGDPWKDNLGDRI